MADVTSIYGNPIKDAVARADISTLQTDVQDVKDGFNKLTQYDITSLLLDGYIGSDGGIRPQTGENYQVYTPDFYPIPYNSQIALEYKLSASSYRSASIFGYDANRNFIKRLASIDGGASANVVLEYTNTDEHIRYIRISFQTYNKLLSAEIKLYSTGFSAIQYAENDTTILEQVENPTDNYSIVYVDAIPDNLIKPEKLFQGYYINASGVPSVGNDWSCSQFINISGFNEIVGKNIGLGAYYDADKKFISSVTVGNSSVTPPTTAEYIRVSILKTNMATAILSYHRFYDFASDYPVSIWKTPNKPYEDGYIRFTVPVNTTVATYESTAETNMEGTPNYVDVDCILTLPYKYKPVGEPCKLLMMCHGAGRGVSGADNWTTNENYNTLVDLFKSSGYAVFDCNGFKNDALGWSFWGNQRGVEAWRKAYMYVTDNYNVEKTFSIYAFSMGGLTAMNLAFQGFPNINAIALGSPVLNLRKVWDATDGTKNVLKVLYGLDDEWDESKVVGNNPYKHITTVDNINYCPYNLPPIKIWYGSTETNNTGNPAIEKEIAKSMVDAIVNSGGYAFYREVSGRGHEICYGASSVVNAEIRTYLDRYERSVPTFN